jgi:hypothetical protein
MKVELSEVQVNPPVDAALFKKPGLDSRQAG